MKQILAFVLLSGMICWFVFSPIFKHVLIMRQAALQQEVDYLLEVGANGSNGYIDQMMIEESKERLAEVGFDMANLEYEVDSDTGAPANNSAAPILRGTGLKLVIRYPIEHLFHIDRLIGVTPPGSDARLQASGMKMSEYVPR